MTGLLSLLILAPHSMLDGVRTIAAPGAPGNVVVWGEGATPVLVDREGNTVVGAAEQGGRVVALSHNGMLGQHGVADTAKLFTNAAKWAARGSVELVLAPGNAGLAAALEKNGLKSAVSPADFAKGRGTVIFLDAHSVQPAQVRPLQEFVWRGGGVVIAATGWGWQQGSQAPMWEFNANKALKPFGIAFGDQFAEKDGNVFTVREVQADHHAGLALQNLKSGTAQANLASTSAVQLLRVLPTTDPWLAAQAKQLLGSQEVAIGPGKGLPRNRAKERFLVAYRWQEIERGVFKSAEPSAKLFPGEVAKDAPRVTVRFAVRPKETRWQSTGLYAAPGERIRLSVPESLRTHGLRLRIGPHKDANWHHNRWDRFPEVSLSWAVNQPEQSFVSPFGGLIYLENPRTLAAESAVTFSQVVRAPRFVLGETTPADWARQIGEIRAPWAEIESKHIVVTVPSTAVANLKDPAPVARYWDQISEATSDLAMTPRWRGFKERFVADAQISAGYMHAGYPIMTGLDVSGMVVDLEKLRREGSWGHFHEIGHNHQNPDWTFDGTGEVTVNLFTLYSYDIVVGQRTGDRRFDAAQCLKFYRDHVAAGGTFDRWKSEPFTALAMYAQLQNAFGWEAFRSVFKSYLELPATQRPRNDNEKRDQWMVRFSRQVGRNLGPFFEAWRVPTSSAARESLKDLPVWMPEGMALK